MVMSADLAHILTVYHPKGAMATNNPEGRSLAESYFLKDLRNHEFNSDRLARNSIIPAKVDYKD